VEPSAGLDPQRLRFAFCLESVLGDRVAVEVEELVMCVVAYQPGAVERGAVVALRESTIALIGSGLQDPA
jgi:hypothetical protein